MTDPLCERNKGLVLAMDEALNRRDWNRYSASFAEQIVWSRHPAHSIVPRDRYVSIIQDIVATFPDWRVIVERLIAESDWVVERIRVEGTHMVRATIPHHGDLRSFEPTGKALGVWQAHFWRIRDGQIIEHEAVRDDLNLFRQLGLA
jgi:predicted ester cyclase